MWIFIYLCNGINVADLVRLKHRNITDGEIGFVRKKTERTSSKVKNIYVARTPETARIIARWGSSPSSDTYLFDCLTDKMDTETVKKKTKDFTKRINKRMKLIGGALGIDGISTYTARHSFATILKNKGIPVTYIAESLGHNDLKTTEHYLASFQKESLQRNAALLMQFDDNEDEN